MTNSLKKKDEVAPVESQNLDQIRNILFGSQTKQTEKHISQLSELLNKEVDSIKTDVKNRFESFESFVKQELNSLSEQLKMEKEHRTKGINEPEVDLHKNHKSLEKADDDLKESLINSKKDFNQQLLDQSKNIRNEIQTKIENMTGSLKKFHEDLNNDKVDKLALADFLTEISLRLKDEFKIPTE